MLNCILVLLALSPVPTAPGSAAKSPPKLSGEIKIGLSGALSGPVRALGEGMRDGISAYFARVNAAGGVFGKQLRLIALDDAYDPALAGANVHRLIDEEKVFAILGNPGTPTAAVAAPIANQRRVPFFGAYTGAGLLRKTPPDRYIVNYRASYAEETFEMVRGLLREGGLKPQDLVFFTQNDAYGDAGYGGALAALKAMGYGNGQALLHVRYPRNTVDVERALSEVLDPTVHPRAVIMIGATAPCAKFIRLGRKLGLTAVFVNVSFVNGDAFLKELGPAAEGVVVTQVVPPLDANLPALKDFRADVARKNRGFVSLEGYLAAAAFVAGLRRAGPEANSDIFIDTMETSGPMDLGLGEALSLTKVRHQLSSHVWPTIIRSGRFSALRNWREAFPAKPGTRT
jgi:ABC-type branched-subunit amino acid transport system substrate-binding protein